MELIITIGVRDKLWNTLSAREVRLQAETVDDLADIAADIYAGLGQLIQRTLAEAAKEAADPAGVVE